MSRKRIGPWTSAAAMLALCLAVTAGAGAQTAYTWAPAGADGNWSDPLAWTSGMPNAAGDVAAFLEPNALAVSLNGQSVTVGQLQFLGDYANYTLSAGAGGVLHLNDANGLAVLAQMGTVTSAGTGGAVRLNVPIVLDSDALFYTNAAKNTNFSGGLFINGPISGAGALTFSGPDGPDSFGRYFWLNGVNTFSGGMTVHRETVWGTNAQSYGTGTITVAGGVLMSYANDDGNADHHLNNVVVSGTSYNEIDLRSGDPTAWASQGPLGSVTLRYGNLTLQAGSSTTEFDGTYADATGKNSSIRFASTTLEDGVHKLQPYGQGIYLGHITGPGRVVQGNRFDQGYLVLNDDTSDFTGGVEVQGHVVLGSAKPTGTAPVTMNGGYLYSFAWDSATADHSLINIDQVSGSDAGGGIVAAQGSTNDYPGSWYTTSDANINVVHKFGNLTFGAQNAQFTVGGGFNNSVRIVGTTTLNGASTLSPNARLFLDGVVTGSGVLMIGSGVNDNMGVFLTNNGNDYDGGTNLVYGSLSITQPNALGTGSLMFNGGNLNSVAADNAAADHSATNVDMYKSGNITGEQGLGHIYGQNAYDDPNVVVHKFGDLTFKAQNVTLSAGDYDTDNDIIAFVGTIALNGDSSFSPYRQAIRLDGYVTGSGDLHAPGANGGLGVILTNNSNDYTDGTRIDPDARVFITAPHALGAGPLILTGGTLYSIALANADADHSATNVDLYNSSMIYGTQAIGATGPVDYGDPNLVSANHKFGDLTFKAADLTLNTGTYGAGADTVEFAGTTTLSGVSTFSTFQRAVLSGLVTGSGTLVVASGNGNAGLVLANNSNNYDGGTEVGNALFVTAPNALGTGKVYLTGGTLYSVASANADADHSGNSVTVEASSAIRGQRNVATDDAGFDDANVVVHQFKDLTFTADGQTLRTGAWNVTNDIIQFNGTTTLVGATSFNTYRQGLVLKGPVVGGGASLNLVDGWDSAAMTLAGDDSTYDGGTVVGPGMVLNVTGRNGLGTGPVTIRDNGGIYGAGATLNLNGAGSINDAARNITNDGLLHVGPGASSLVGDVVAGPITYADPNYTYTRSIQLDADSTLSVHSMVQNSASVGVNATLTLRQASRPVTSIVNSVVIAGSTNAWTGSVDVKNNALIVKQGDLATINNQLKTGANLDTGFQDGKGINSSVAASGDGSHGVGSVTGQNYIDSFGDENGSASFNGESVSPTDTLLAYTWMGDADLDGKVTFDDFQLWQNAYQLGLTDSGWYNADFNYDGVVNFDDFQWWQNSYQQSQNVEPGTPGVVPEPATLVLLALGAVSLLVKRRVKV